MLQRNPCGPGKDVAILGPRRQAIDEWRANHPVPSQNPKPEVTEALAEAERAIESFAQGSAVRVLTLCSTAPRMSPRRGANRRCCLS